MATITVLTTAKTPMTMPIEDKLRWLRERDGRSQKDLAESIGRFQSRVSKWEIGTGKLAPSDILKIAEYFRVPMRYLCDDAIEYPEECDPEADFVAFLPEDYKVVWAIVKQIGARDAMARLLGQAAPPPGGPMTPGRPVGAMDLPRSADPRTRKAPHEPQATAGASAAAGRRRGQKK